MFKPTRLWIALIAATAVVAALAVGIAFAGAGPFGDGGSSANASEPTFADQEAATQATLDCMSVSGLAVRTIPGAGLRNTVIGYTVSSEDQLPAAQKIEDDCVAKTGLNDIQIQRALQPKTDAQNKDMLGKFSACLLANGVIESPLAASGRGLSDLVESLRGEDLSNYSGCADRVAAETGIHP